MSYRQFTPGERYMLAALRKQGLNRAEIARALGRHPATIGRELRRNGSSCGHYRPSKAQQRANGRRSRKVAAPVRRGRARGVRSRTWRARTRSAR